MLNKRGTRARSRIFQVYFQDLISRKRSQLTIFIIIAILIVAGVVLFLTLKGNLKIPGKPISPETTQVQSFVQECLDDSLEEAVFQVGENGGYYSLSSAPAKTPLLEIPYYIRNNENLMPSKEKIQDEIEKGIEKELFLCVGSLELSPEYEITKGEMDIKTKIEPERVLVDAEYPLTIIKDETKSKIKDFDSEIPVRFGVVYDAVAEFISRELEISEEICVSCLLEILAKNGLYINNFKENDNTEIFVLTDTNSIINKKEFIYNFANEY